MYELLDVSSFAQCQVKDRTACSAEHLKTIKFYFLPCLVVYIFSLSTTLARHEIIQDCCRLLDVIMAPFKLYPWRTKIALQMPYSDNIWKIYRANTCYCAVLLSINEDKVMWRDTQMHILHACSLHHTKFILSGNKKVSKKHCLGFLFRHQYMFS